MRQEPAKQPRGSHDSMLKEILCFFFPTVAFIKGHNSLNMTFLNNWRHYYASKIRPAFSEIHRSLFFFKLTTCPSFSLYRHNKSKQLTGTDSPPNNLPGRQTQRNAAPVERKFLDCADPAEDRPSGQRKPSAAAKNWAHLGIEAVRARCVGTCPRCK